MHDDVARRGQRVVDLRSPGALIHPLLRGRICRRLVSRKKVKERGEPNPQFAPGQPPGNIDFRNA